MTPETTLRPAAPAASPRNADVFLESAARIGARIAALAEWDGEECNWTIMAPDRDNGSRTAIPTLAGAILLLGTVRLDQKFDGYRPETVAFVLALFVLWVADRAFVERDRRLEWIRRQRPNPVYCGHWRPALLVGWSRTCGVGASFLEQLRRLFQDGVACLRFHLAGNLVQGEFLPLASHDVARLSGRTAAR